jgi:hypothetical protein
MFVRKIVLALVATLLVCLLLSTPVLAGKGDTEQNSKDCPGWGYGDNNHSHWGPPGQGGGTPGWGYGDNNHPHWGPPPSVKPGWGFGKWFGSFYTKWRGFFGNFRFNWAK